MFTLFAIFSGILLTPFIYLQGYIYQALSTCLDVRHKPNVHAQFFCVVSIFTLILLLLTFPLRIFFYSQASAIYLLSLYIILFCLLFEIYSFFINNKSFQKIDIFLFTQLFLVVGGIYCSLIYLNKNFMTTFFIMIGMCLGMFSFFFFTRNLYFSILSKYCHPALQNPIFGLLISSFLMGLFTLIYRLLPNIL